MKIVAIGDLHGSLPQLPPCDVVVIAGDIVPLNKERDGVESAEWFRGEFQQWCLTLPCKKVVLIGGNHDFLLSKLLEEYTIEEVTHGLFACDSENKIVLLHDCAYTYDGVIFYGTAWCNLPNWAFYADDKVRKEKFEQIPNCDILLTHCPPKVGTQGVVLGESRVCGVDFGDAILAKVLASKRVKRVVSGHIHSGDHNIERIGDTKCRNCSVKDENYEISYKPFEFEI